MNPELIAYIYAFSSVLTFSTAAIGFTYFSQKVSPLWMNIFKCVVSFFFSVIIMFILEKPLWMVWDKAWPFLLSGFIGLNFGDLFLLSAYKRIGPGRTLVLFGFQPFIAGGFSYFFWEEKLHTMQFFAIIFFVLCLFLFSYEQFKKSGHWEVRGLLFALSGVVLDSIGVILSRHGFNEAPELMGLEGQYFRTLGALVSFVVYLPFVKIHFFHHLNRLSRKERVVAVVSSFFGTFLSLVFYMQAIRVGKLATVTSIVLTDPMMSTFFECVWLRVWPTRYLWIAILCFLGAMFCLMYPQWALI